MTEKEAQQQAFELLIDIDGYVRNDAYPVVTAALLAASKPSKVLGTLPVTADGWLVGLPPGYGGVWHLNRSTGEIHQADPTRLTYEQASRCVVVWVPALRMDVPVGCCYSTKAAAEAARREAP